MSNPLRNKKGQLAPTISGRAVLEQLTETESRPTAVICAGLLEKGHPCSKSGVTTLLNKLEKAGVIEKVKEIDRNRWKLVPGFKEKLAELTWWEAQARAGKEEEGSIDNRSRS